MKMLSGIGACTSWASGKSATCDILEGLEWLAATVYYIAGAIAGVASGVWLFVLTPLLATLKVKLGRQTPPADMDMQPVPSELCGASDGSGSCKGLEAVPSLPKSAHPSGLNTPVPSRSGFSTPRSVPTTSASSPRRMSGADMAAVPQPPAPEDYDVPDAATLFNSGAALAQRTGDNVNSMLPSKAPSEGGGSVLSAHSTASSRSGKPKSLAGSTAVPGSSKHKTGLKRAAIR